MGSNGPVDATNYFRTPLTSSMSLIMIKDDLHFCFVVLLARVLGEKRKPDEY